MEFLVLAVTVWVEVAAKWHKRKLRQLQNKLFAFMSKGQELHWSKPREGVEFAEYPVNLPWENEVKSWIRETSDFLKRLSPKAAAWFLQEVNST